MKLGIWAIVAAVAGVVAFIASGVLKNHTSGVLGIVGEAVWLAFLLCVLALIVIGVIVLVRYVRHDGTVSRA